jgi:uncharacterized membrane protein
MATNTAEVAGLRLLKAFVRIIYAIAFVAAIVLAFAFALLLVDASTKSSFVAFIYDTAKLFAQPFIGMLKSTKLANGGVIDWAALFAIAAYSVLAWLIGMAVNAISHSIYRESHEATPRPPKSSDAETV